MYVCVSVYVFAVPYNWNECELDMIDCVYQDNWDARCETDFYIRECGFQGFLGCKSAVDTVLLPSQADLGMAAWWHGGMAGHSTLPHHRPVLVPSLASLAASLVGEFIHPSIHPSIHTASIHSAQ
jgi:hypothetical protein